MVNNFNYGEAHSSVRPWSNTCNYLLDEADAFAIETAFKLLYPKGFMQPQPFLSPLIPFTQDDSRLLCMKILEYAELNDEVIDIVIASEDTELFDALRVNILYNIDNFTTAQCVRLLSSPLVPEDFKLTLSMCLNREKIDSLMKETTDIKLHICKSLFLYEEEVVELAQSSSEYLERLYFNKYTPMELIYENFFVKNEGKVGNINWEKDLVETKSEIERLFFYSRFDEFKDVASKKLDVDMSFCDRKWVMKFLNWKI